MTLELDTINVAAISITSNSCICCSRCPSPKYQKDPKGWTHPKTYCTRLPRLPAQEYRAAAQRLCVAPAWLSTTKLLRSAGRLATVCREELAALKLRAWLCKLLVGECGGKTPMARFLFKLDVPPSRSTRFEIGGVGDQFPSLKVYKGYDLMTDDGWWGFVRTMRVWTMRTMRSISAQLQNYGLGRFGGGD